MIDSQLTEEKMLEFLREQCPAFAPWEQRLMDRHKTEIAELRMLIHRAMEEVEDEYWKRDANAVLRGKF